MLFLRRVLASTILIGLFIAGLLGTAGCTTPATSAGGFHPLPSDLSAVGLKPLWQRPLILIPGEKIVNVWRVGDAIYVATSEAHVICLNASAGTMTWEINLVDTNSQIFRPAEVPGDKYLLILNRGGAFLVDKQSGAIVLRKSLDIAVTTDPIIAAPNVFCTGSVNYFYAFYLDTLGGHVWRIAAPNDVFTALPAVQGGSLLLASESGHLWRVDLAKGDWQWKDRQTGGRVVGGLAADGRAVYVPCLDENVYAFDLNNGGELWVTPLKGGLDRDLIATRSEVLVPASDHTLYALSSVDGKTRWQVPGVKYVGTLAGDRVWVMDSAGNLKALSLDTGEVLASAAVGGGFVVANTSDRQVILVSKSGVVGVYTPAR